VVTAFAHRGEKRASVMRLAWSEYGPKAIRAEIALCELRCCNCHRRRTAAAAKHFRYREAAAAAAVDSVTRAPMV
jgi:hypothetical protein